MYSSRLLVGGLHLQLVPTNAHQPYVTSYTANNSWSDDPLEDKPLTTPLQTDFQHNFSVFESMYGSNPNSLVRILVNLVPRPCGIEEAAWYQFLVHAQPFLVYFCKWVSVIQKWNWSIPLLSSVLSFLSAAFFSAMGLWENRPFCLCEYLCLMTTATVCQHSWKWHSCVGKAENLNGNSRT